MRSRTLAILGLTLALFLIGAFAWLSGKRINLTITQAQIDEALAKRFPVTKRHLLLFEITYSDAVIRLLPDANRIDVRLNAELNLKIGKEPRRLGGGVEVTTGLRYAPESQQFFLSDPVLHSFSINGVPSEYLEKVTVFATRVAREHLEQQPIYTLRATDTKKAIAKALLKDFKVRDQEVHVTLGL